MNKREAALLEKAFIAEVDAALGKLPIWFLQTKSKLAEKLVDEGYLQRVETKVGGRFPVVVKGFELTHLGRLEYCSTC